MTDEQIEAKVDELFAQGGEIDELDETQVQIDIGQPQRDMWHQRGKSIANMEVPTVRGASPAIKTHLADLLDSGISQAYKKAIDDSELLRQQGDRTRADLVLQQYMRDWFYPIVDTLIRLSSQEEVLASQEVLESLDALALVPGGGNTAGYTSMYVSSLYEPTGEQTFVTDDQVLQAIRRINKLCDDGQVRAAASLAQRTQEQIDRGDNRATPEDYEFLQTIAIRGS